MTKPISEPTPALEAANYGWRIRQLERRPTPPNAWARVGFTGEYTFAAGTYNAASDWSLATLSYFITNSLGTYEIDFPNNGLIAQSGIYHAHVAFSIQINGQFLDLPPQAGTTRLHKGCLQTQLRLNSSTGSDLDWTHDWTEAAYDLSQGSILGLGRWHVDVAGILAATSTTTFSPRLFSEDALIGPNNTGSFPALAPVYGGEFHLVRIGNFGTEEIFFP